MSEEPNVLEVEELPIIIEEDPIPPVKLAFIIDGEVVEILHTDHRLGAIFLSSPVIVDVTEIQNLGALMGTTFNEETGEFIPPSPKE